MTATPVVRSADRLQAGPLETALEAREVTYLHAPGRGVDGLTLGVPLGAIYGLIGPNGSGKSTLLTLASGLLTPQSGRLSLLGSPPGRQVAAKLGWVFQDQSLDASLTVEETLALSASLYGRERESSRRALEVVGLLDRVQEPVGTLSGGMKRRLELARAVQHSPQLLMMDEPTLGLDLDSRRGIWDHLAELNALGLTVVVATNDVTEAERVCTEVAFLREGRLVAAGSPAQLKAGLREQSVELRWPGLSNDEFQRLCELDGVSGAARRDETVHLTAEDGRSLLAAIARLSSGQIEEVEIRQSSLEDAYFNLAGAPLLEEEKA